MKVKGINIFEQHAEKAVVAVVALAVLAALALQFLTESTVKVGNQDVPVGQAFDQAERLAQNVRASIDDSEPALPEAPAGSIASALDERLAGRVGARPRVDELDSAFTVLAGAGGPVDVRPDELFAPFEPQPPMSPIASAYQGAIHPLEVLDHGGLASLTPAEQPFDVSAITVAARYDGVTLKDRLERAPEGRRALPRAWARDLEVIGVELQRQQRGADGAWSNPQAVASAPGRHVMLAAAQNEQFLPGDMPELLDIVRDTRRSVVQPAFYDVIGDSESWAPPEEGLDLVVDPGVDPQNADRIERLRRQLRTVERRLVGFEERLGRLQGQDGRRPPPDRNPDGGGRDGGRDGGRGRDGGPPPRDNADPRQQQIQSLEERIQESQDEIQEIKDQLAELGVVEETPEAALDDRPAYDPSGLPPLPPLLENESLRLWAHDLTGEPGAEYRYRIRPIFNNPMFGQTLAESQRDMAASPIAPGPWSDWTEPVMLPEMSYYFVTNATPAGELGEARATFELYRFYYGSWRAGRANIQPGDELAATIDIEPGPIFDLEKIREGLQRGPDGDPARDRFRDRDADRRRERDLEGFEPPAGGGDADGTEDELYTPGPSELVFDVGSVLLDVASDVGSEGVQVILYNAGPIEVRRPAAERRSDWFQRLQSLVESRPRASATRD
ncbi:MAG: hypothetical protein AAGK04_09355 [Planctomycetota bacterium]